MLFSYHPHLIISVYVELILVFMNDNHTTYICCFFEFRVSVAMGLPELPVVLLVPRLFSDGFDLLGMGDIVCITDSHLPHSC